MIKDLLESPEGKGRLEFLFGKYFFCLENGKKDNEKNLIKLNTAMKYRSYLKTKIKRIVLV